jgi:hypothetical protein
MLINQIEMTEYTFENNAPLFVWEELMKSMGNIKTPNYWDSGFCPSSGILKTRKYNVSGTGSVSVLR